MEPDEVGQDFPQEMEEAQEGGDTIGFAMGSHPITGEPLLVMMIKDRNGGQTSTTLRSGDALNLGAQITAQGTLLNTLIHLAQVQAASQANGGGLIIPGK